MSNTISSKIEGDFTGYNGGAVFRLANGQVWQQKLYKYKYRYMYQPSVHIIYDGNEHMLHVDCMDEPVAVVRVSIIEDGPIVSVFKGYTKDALRVSERTCLGSCRIQIQLPLCASSARDCGRRYQWY